MGTLATKPRDRGGRGGGGRESVGMKLIDQQNTNTTKLLLCTRAAQNGDLQGLRVSSRLQAKGLHDLDELVCGFARGFHSRGPRDHHLACWEHKARSLWLSYSHHLVRFLRVVHGRPSLGQATWGQQGTRQEIAVWLLSIVPRIAN